MSTPAELAATVRNALDLSKRTTMQWDNAFAALAELERLATEERQIAHDMFQDARSESLRAEAAEARTQQLEESLREIRVLPSADDLLRNAMARALWTIAGVALGWSTPEDASAAVLAAGGPTKDAPAPHHVTFDDTGRITSITQRGGS
jgi:hypothetical protein